MFVSRECYPYECPFCGYAQRTLLSCMRHTYRHLKGYSAYRCSHCDRGYMRMEYLKIHSKSRHPYQEIKYEKVDPPDDPVILVNVSIPHNSNNATGAARRTRVTKMFKCAFCDHVCIPNDMPPHFMSRHPTKVPQMKIFKDQNLLEKIAEPPVAKENQKPPVSRPVTVEPAKKNIVLKSTAKKAYNYPSPSTSSKNSIINEFLSDIAEPCVSDKELKIWNRSRSICVPVKYLQKMINFNCTVRLDIDIFDKYMISYKQFPPA